MAVAHKKETRYTKSPISRKVKRGGRRVVSEALVKHGVTNLVPNVHVKRGDTVILISGPKKDGKYEADLKKRLDERNAYKGQIGKVLSVSPEEGKITVEGVNMITRHQKQRGVGQQAGMMRKEGPLFASRVMLYCNACKKPTRVKHKIENGKKSRVCRHCAEGF
ncbi:MAG TPA: 50S ribosomal protein L24 [Candidatus Obscuribacterales bacterium]